MNRTPHPVPLAIRWGEGVRRTGEGKSGRFIRKPTPARVEARWLTALATLLSASVLVAATAVHSNEAILRAQASVQAATARAQADPTRPIYHVAPPAHWNNDPNGPIYHRGYYHLFYQHNPYGDDWGNMHWGHIRSPDLAHWEHLPIALWPSKESGEDHVFSGCAVLAGGRPMIFYTSIGRGKEADVHAEQWAALGDPDLIRWQKHPANPILTEGLHGDMKVYDWRDPFYFEHDGRHYLVLGGNLNHAQGGQAVVLLYEALNDDLTQWTYRGILFRHPDPQVKDIECPNFFRLGRKWVLLVSPYGRVEYFVGDFNPTQGEFAFQTRGLLDASDQFYALNTLLNHGHRRVLWAWVRGGDGVGRRHGSGMRPSAPGRRRLAGGHAGDLQPPGNKRGGHGDGVSAGNHRVGHPPPPPPG